MQNNPQLPSSQNAEAAVLGSMCLDPQTIPVASEILKVTDFFWPANQIIFECLCEMFADNDGGGVDGVLLRNKLEKKGKLEEVGGVDYLAAILESVPTAANIIHYARIVNTKALERGLAASVIQLSYVVNDTITDVAEKREAYMQAAMELQTTEKSQVVHIEKVVLEVTGKILDPEVEKITEGLSTGFIALDEITRGLSAGQLIIIAGRTSMGKTALALQIALNLAFDKHHPIFFSMEMPATELVERLLSSASRVNLHRLKTGRLSDLDYQDLIRATEKLTELNMWIDSTPTLTPASLTMKVLAAKSRNKIDCVFVDYIQLMRGGRNFERRHLELEEICRQLKALALKAGLPVVLLCQLSRKTDDRPDHRPRLMDLKESGSIEETADIVILLYRQDYYRKSERKKGEKIEFDGLADVIIAKHRQGPTGDVELIWLPEFTSFENPPVDKDLFEQENEVNE